MREMSKYSVNGLLFDVPEGVTHFKFLPSGECNVRVVKDIMIFEYTQGITAGEFCRLVSLESVYPESVLIPYLVPTEIKFQSVGINQDDEFIKICHEDINVTQLKYKIADTKLINKFYNLTLLLGAVDGLDSINVDEYYNLLESTGLLIAMNRVENSRDLRNVEIHNSKVHDIKSTRVYLPQSKYQKYRISNLDYISDFINKLSDVFTDYGFELVEYEKIKDAESKNIVTFRINTHAKEFLKRVHPRIPEHNIMFSGARISFMLMTPETDIYEDFKMRYNNIDLVQNMREFKCPDKYGYMWRYDITWQGQLDDTFSHDFPQTDLSTYGYQFPFTATLEFFDVYDVVYDLIQELSVNPVIKDSVGINPEIEEEIRNFTDIEEVSGS